jgi:potassium channel subfamily K
MALKGIFLYIAASYGRVTSNTNNRHPEIGRLEIVPEDTLEPCDYRNDLDDDDDALNEDVDDADDDDPLDLNPRRFRRFSSIQTAVTSFSRSFTFVDQPTWFQKFRYFVFPPKEDIESFIPNYRYIPILSGFLIPFCILLEIPGLTQHWYVRTENNEVIEQRANPVILDVGVGISLACAVIANLCLITRFLERRVKTMTILCAAFLTFHGTSYCISIIYLGL